jgi:hypothetical protein
MVPSIQPFAGVCVTFTINILADGVCSGQAGGEE